MSNKLQPSWKLISFLTVLALGVMAFVVLQSKGGSPKDAARAIAAIPRTFSEMETEQRAPVTREITHAFGCGKEGDFSTPLQEEFVRFKGSLCGKQWKQLSAIVIANKTNGFTASVFTLGDKDFLTDHIKLNDGRNEIVVRYEAATGPLEETVVIMHQRPHVDDKHNQAFYF